jgi:hypothetical protein
MRSGKHDGRPELVSMLEGEHAGMWSEQLEQVLRENRKRYSATGKSVHRSVAEKEALERPDL